ncbi:MAG: YkgJ family cysteine cluster protein [Deltaproteobacteria bacterium]|nr:YkgJ family cysteine cluster protein [Deltaproteobacteria bacterium]
MPERKERLKTGEDGQLAVCKACKAACCRYISIAISPPRTREDFDNLRWYLLHQGVSIFQDQDGDWMVNVPTGCRMLKKDYTCMIYEDRPGACRDYDANECENTEQEGNYKNYFEDENDLEDYLDKRWHRSQR